MNLKTKKILCGLGLATGLMLTGCEDNFNYTENENGEIVAEGNISYSILSKCDLVEIRKLDNTNDIYICSCSNYIYYTNIENNKYFICKNNDLNEQLEFVRSTSMIDYLITYDEVKESYSVEDIDRILEKIKNDYEFDLEKVNVMSGE